MQGKKGSFAIKFYENTLSGTFLKINDKKPFRS